MTTKRSWTLWVHKQMGVYFDPEETPRIGGKPSSKTDFEWVTVVEVKKTKKKRTKK